MHVGQPMVDDCEFLLFNGRQAVESQRKSGYDYLELGGA
jgi:hypothetical protein